MPCFAITTPRPSWTTWNWSWTTAMTPWTAFPSSCSGNPILTAPFFNRSPSKPVNEALRQRVVVHYDFGGLSDEEVAKYVSHKIQMAVGSLCILSEAALSAVHGYAQGNARMIDNLMTDALIIGEQTEKQGIDPETILAAVNNQQLWSYASNHLCVKYLFFEVFQNRGQFLKRAGADRVHMCMRRLLTRCVWKRCN